MQPFEPPRVHPPDRPAGALVVADPPDLTFEGFGPDALGVLDRLKAHPHVEQYRKEKALVRSTLTEPFWRYRDDLVVNWVLPSQLDFETEKNVFSRLLKNDFGAGGCHHHLWLSFYRPGRRRLTDFQLVHSLSPDGLAVGLYVGDYAQPLVRHAAGRIVRAPEAFRALLAPLLRRSGWSAAFYERSAEHPVRASHPAAELADMAGRMDGFWVGTTFARADVLAWEGALVRHALGAVIDVWPVYTFLAQGS